MITGFDREMGMVDRPASEDRPGWSTDRRPESDGSVSGATESTDRSDPPRVWPLISVALIALLAAGVVVGIAISRMSGSSTADRARTPVGDVRLEPVTYGSDDPFTESMVTLDDDELSTVSGPPTEGFAGRVPGGTDRLYGSRRAAPPCDAGGLAEALTTDGAVADAFVDVVGVDPDDTAQFVRSLTPVLLRADTAVTNHAYRDGRAEPFQAVLQAGTPVLIDSSGVPRVKCSCGNPLALPEWDVAEFVSSNADRPTADGAPRFTGDRWDSFDPSFVVEVEPATEPTPRITTVDFDSGDEDSVSLGGMVALDGILVSTAEGVAVVGDDDSVTTVIADRVDAVLDDGKGGLIYTLARPEYPGQKWSSTPPADPAQGAIWYLAAGSTEAINLTAGSPAGVWHHLWTVGAIGPRTYVVYEEYGSGANGGTGTTDHDDRTGRLLIRDLETGKVIDTEDGTWDDGGVSWVAIGGDRLAYGTVADDVYNFMVVLDESLTSIPNVCDMDGDVDLDSYALCPSSAVLDEDGRLIGPAERLGRGTERTELSDVFAVEPVTGELIDRWKLDLGPAPDEYGVVDQARDGKVVLSTWDYTPSGTMRTNTGLFELASGRRRQLPSEVTDEIWSMWILGSPLLRPVVRVDDTAEEQPDGHEATTEPTAPTWDQIKNAEIPAMCMHDPARLVDGEDVGLGEYEGYFHLLQRLESGQPGIVQGVPSDAGPLTAVVVSCNAGGVAWPNDVMFFAPDETVYGVLYDDEDLNWNRLRIDPAREGIQSIRLVDGQVEVTTRAQIGDDAMCCPSGMGTIRMRAENGRIVVTSSELL